MKKLFLSLFLLISSFGFAQEASNYIDVVYLKDGSIIKGQIIKHIIGESILIKAQTDEELTYPSSTIEKIEKEILPKPKWMNHFKEKKNGWFIEGETTIGFTNRPRGVINITNGYKFNRFAYLGLGLGVGLQEEPYYGFSSGNPKRNEPDLEALISFSGDILNKRVTPFYQVSAGYSYLPTNSGFISNKLENGNWQDANYSFTGRLVETYGGPFGEVGFGVRVKSLKRVYYKFGLDLRIGSELYTYKSVYYENGQEDLLITSDTDKFWSSNGSFQLRFGIGF